MIKLLAVDMDGTLLDENSQIPPETYGLIRELREVGVRFAVSSGRRHDTLEMFWGEVAKDIDYIASNGTEVVCDGKTLCDLSFERDDLVRLKELCDRLDCLHMLCHSKEHRYIMELNWEIPGTPPGEVGYEMRATEIPEEPIFKTVIVNDRTEEISDLLYSLSQELGDRLNFLPYSSHAIDVMPRGISKATGLEVMRKHLGIRREEIAAYGDSMNDYEMLRYVGHPTVMGNALYGVEAIAERVIEPNTEHGVQKDMARIIESLKAGGNGLD